MGVPDALLEKNEPRTERATLASAAHEREALDARGLARSPRHGMDLNEPEPMEPQHLTTSDATYVVAVAESDDEEVITPEEFTEKLDASEPVRE